MVRAQPRCLPRHPSPIFDLVLDRDISLLQLASMELRDGPKKTTFASCVGSICLGAFYMVDLDDIYRISGLVLLYFVSWLLIANGTFAAPPTETNHFSVAASYATYRRGEHYPGFDKLQHLFVFGDSYSATGFDPKGEQPSEANPVGNPDFPGATNTNGKNWVDYLITTYNISYLPAIDFAVGGATVDEKILQIGHIHGLTGLAKEVEKEFLSIYANKSRESPIPWSGETSLFFTWIGINDIGNAEKDSELEASMERYIGLVDELYKAGARNFMFFYVPPIHRTPHAVTEGVEAKWKTWTETWNANIMAMATNLTTVYPETTTFVFDAYRLFNDVIDNPAQFPETAWFKDTKSYCFGYIFGTESWNSTDPNCDYAVNEYLWVNDFHPTTVMHNLIAHEVANALNVK